MIQPYWDYLVLGGSLDGVTIRVPKPFEGGVPLQLPMRAPGPSTEVRPDPEGRHEVYRLESDGKVYFLNEVMKEGKRLTPEGVREPSRITDGKNYYDYRFVGGSHDGNNMSFPHDFEVGFTMSLDMRGEHGPRPGGRKEVFKLEADGRFHYQNAIMQGGRQIHPPPKRPEPPAE